jgi:NAD(P)-dependent dehydrogenase (short-subunit alcohol dehydrogenase family)
MCKGGIVSIAKALALSLAPDIRTNVIAPGVVETPMLAKFFGRDPNADIEAGVKKFIDTGVPLNRVCTAEEIAQVALFLASDQSQYMTGVTLPVDGGYVAR